MLSCFLIKSRLPNPGENTACTYVRHSQRPLLPHASPLPTWGLCFPVSTPIPCPGHLPPTPGSTPARVVQADPVQTWLLPTRQSTPVTERSAF